MDKKTNKIKKFYKPEIFRDPIHNYIYLDYIFLEKLIDTTIFQRLRRIKQLGCSNIIFHSAEHSRFTHSLGVYELARRFLELQNIKKHFSEREKLLLMTTALMHDIGHGAYSHVFEKCFNIKHEKQSANIIINSPEISNLLDKTVDNNFKYDIANIIEKKNNFPLLEQIITSQLDIDRLDYLERDAYFTGAVYGYVDTNRLMNSICITKNKIAFKSSSFYAIENYLINRYHMYWQVYHHPKIISYSIILEKIFLRIKTLIKNNTFFNNKIEIIKKFIQNEKDLETYLQVDDFYVNGLIVDLKNNEDKILSTLCNDFLNRNIWKFMENNDKNKTKINEIIHYYKNDKDFFTSDKNISKNAYIEKEQNPEEKIFIINEKENILRTFKEESKIIKSIIKYDIKKNLKLFFYRPLK